MEREIIILLTRMQLYLEEGKWEEATTFADRALEADPGNADAYVGKLMADLHIHTFSELMDSRKSFTKNKNYQLALQYADESLKEKLLPRSQKNSQKVETTKENPPAPKESPSTPRKGKKGLLFAAAAVILLLGAAALAGPPLYRKSQLAKADEFLQNGQYEEATVLLEKYDPENAENRIDQSKYDRAIAALEAKNYSDGFSILRELGDYADSSEQINHFHFQQALDYKEAGDLKQALATIVLVTSDEARAIEKELNYAVGKEYFASKQYVKAAEHMEKAKGYENAREIYQEACYCQAQLHLQTGDAAADKAYEYFTKAGFYKDSYDLKKKAAYLYALYLEKGWEDSSFDYNSSEEIIDWYEKSDGYEDAAERAKRIDLTMKVDNLDFLVGRWTNSNGYYMIFEYGEDERIYCSYNLPFIDRYNAPYYNIANGILFFTDENDNVLQNAFKLTLLGDNTMSVYCYYDGTTHLLYR